MDNAPAGWLTIKEDKRVNKEQIFQVQKYESLFLKKKTNGNGLVHDFYLGTTNEIEQLRPRSPSANQ